jgi:hypothetical protein
MTNEEVEAIINEVFPGLTLYYRDTDLSSELISRYKKGSILLEPAFTDCSYLGGRPTGNTRYLIASSKAADLGKVQPDVSKYGMMVLNAGAFFKVLDIYEIDGFTQILLLHIPSHTVDFFKITNSNLEQTVIEKCRALFEKRMTDPEVEILTTDDWKSRVDFPIGISKEGKNYFKDMQ